MMLNSKGSVGACTPIGISAFLLCAFTAHQDEMIDHRNAEQLAGLDQACGQGAVLAAGGGVATGMIVRANEGCRIG